MSLLGRLFGRDPAALLVQASELLKRDDPSRALALARRVEHRSEGRLQERARELADQADARLLAIAIERVDVAERAELWEEALDYTQVALERASDIDIRRPLKQRARIFQRRIDEQAEAAATTEAQALADRAADDRPAAEIEFEAHYHALLDSLVDEVVGLWQRLPEAFRPAWVALNTGDTATAAETLEVLCEQFPSEPALRLERGRCRLLQGDGVGARADFEAVWEVFGVEPFDHAGALSLPTLWSEAQLAAGEPEAVLTRLAEISPPQHFDPALTAAYAAALQSSERWPEAAEFLANAHRRFPAQQDFTQRLAGVLDRLERPAEAISLLDSEVRSCCSGACGGRSLHLPSVSLLIRLLLDQQGAEDRVEELFAHIHLAQGGVWTHADAVLLERYHRQQGNQEAAEETAELLHRLAIEGAGEPTSSL